jgi:hypothetical protein
MGIVGKPSGKVSTAIGVFLPIGKSAKLPAKIHFDCSNLIACKTEYFRISSAPARSGVREFVRHDHFITGLDDSNKAEFSALSGPRPAAVKVAFAAQTGVKRAGEREVIRESPFNQASVSIRKSAVDVAYSLCSDHGGPLLVVLMPEPTKSQREIDGRCGIRSKGATAGVACLF